MTPVNALEVPALRALLERKRRQERIYRLANEYNAVEAAREIQALLTKPWARAHKALDAVWWQLRVAWVTNADPEPVDSIVREWGGTQLSHQAEDAALKRALAWQATQPRTVNS